MDLKQYLQVAYKFRLLLLFGVVVGLGAGIYTISTTEKTYVGRVSFFVSTTGEGTASSANVGDQFALRRVNSYLELLSTDRLAMMIIDDTGIETTPGFLRSRTDGSANVNTVLMQASFVHENRDVALTISESLSRQFVELVSEVERPLTGEPTVRLEVVSGPTVSVVPVRTKLILASRAMAGLLMAAAIALIRELTDNRLHSVDEMLALADGPLLGLISYDRRAAHSPLILSDGLRSPRAESYRQLRTNLQFIDTENRAKVIVVTSSIASEGKSTTAANLAITLAQSGQSVVVVDADLRKPTIGDLFSFEPVVGLTDVLLGHIALDEVLHRWGDSQLVVLPSGAPPPNPSELLGTVATQRLITDLQLRFDTVVIDTPPLLPVTDAAVVAPLADGVVLVVRPGKVTKAQFQRAVGQLDRVGARLLGFVCSMLPQRSTGTYGTYGTYGEIDSDSDKETALSGRPLSSARPDMFRSDDSESARDEAPDPAQSPLDVAPRRPRNGTSGMS